METKTRVRIIAGILLPLFAAFTLSSCANIANDSTRTKTESGIVGAIGGAIVGAVGGLIVGGDAKSAAFGAAGGAVAGGAAGVAYGSHVAKEKAKYAREEDWLSARLAMAKQTNREVVQYNKRLKTRVDTLQKETASLKKKKSNAESKKKALIAKRQQVNKEQAGVQQALVNTQEQLKMQQAVVADARKSKQGDFAESIENEVEKLKRNIAELEARNKDLASLSASMSV